MPRRKPRWKISDGTVVYLGGKVVGSSSFAERLRQDLRDGVLVGFDPLPSDRGIELDVNDLLHVDTWVRREVNCPALRDLELRLLEAPDNVPDPPPSNFTGSDMPPGTIF